MSQQKPLIFSNRLFAGAVVASVFLVFGIVLIFSPHVSASHATECSDVYTPLSTFVNDGVAANKAFYVRAMNETGVPWELLAAIHYRETSFSHNNPNNGQGIFQFVNGDGGPYPAGPVSDENFYTQLRYMANRLQSDYAFRNSPNPASVQTRRLTANEQDINLIKNTLYSYNGRSSEYAAQATHFGFNQPYEGSPYVMNRFDCYRARMGLITHDYGTIDGIDTRYGAFTIFARLRGDDYWKLLTVPYSWSLVSQEAYYNPERTNPALTNMLASNQLVYLRVKARNMGNTSWANNGSNPIDLGTNNPQDRLSSLCDTSWLSCKRAATLKETTVAPGDIGTFEFVIKMPTAYGSYREDFNIVAEGKTWLNDLGLYWSFEVKPPTNLWQLSRQEAYSDPSRTKKFSSAITAVPGSKIYLRIKAKNMGNEVWESSSLSLGTSHPNDRTSPFYDTSWLSKNRLVNASETLVNPGQIGTFTFVVTAPSVTGSYREYFNLVVDGRAWLNDTGQYYDINVVSPTLPLSMARDKLLGGESLVKGEHLLSSDTQSILTLQPDGNLVLYSDFSEVVWDARIQNLSNLKLTMQQDGNLVLYDGSGGAIWYTGTEGNSGAYLVLQTDGNLVIYNSANIPIWTINKTHNPDHLAYVNTTLFESSMYPHQSLETANRKYKLVQQADGNLVLYSLTRALWSTTTAGSKNRLDLQADGNMVIYNSEGQPAWNSGTYGHGPSQLVMQSDGNLVLYSLDGLPIWATNTAGL